MKKNVNRRKQNFVLGAMLLMISGIASKLIGAFFKVPLTNMIGDDGMGYFSAAYSIYTVLFTISTAGIPVAVSRIISSYIVKNDGKAVKRTYGASLAILTVLGVAGTAFMFIFAPQLAANFIKNEKAEYAIRALAPTLAFICLESALRGFFQGHQNMTPTSVSQVIEAVCKLGIGIGAALYAQSKGYPVHVVAAFAILGIGTGAALSCVYLVITKIAYRKYDYGMLAPGEASPSTKKIFAEIAVIAIPITLSSLVLSVTNVIDSTLINRCLQGGGLTVERALQLVAQAAPGAADPSQTVVDAANLLYGNYTSLAVTMFNLPLVLLTPLSISIIPVLSEAFTKNDRPRINAVTDSAFRLQTAVSLPCAMGLCVLAEPALRVLYRQSSAKLAAPLLSILAVSIFFVAMTSVTNAMLQSLHKQWLPIISMACGVAVKFVAAYVLISMPEVNIYGAPISTVLCYFTAMMLNFVFLARHAKCVPSIRRVFLRPFFASAICAGAAYAAYKLVSRFAGERILVTLASIAFAALVYAVALFAVGALEKDDILLMPKGAKVYELLCRARLIRK